MESFKICFPICDFGNVSLHRNNDFFNITYNNLNFHVFFNIISSIFYYYKDRLKLIKGTNVMIKSRKDLNYSTRKLYKQKGTGAARMGSRKSPLLKGGSASFIYKSRYKKMKILRRKTKVVFFYILITKRAYIMVTLMFICIHKYKMYNNFLVDWLKLVKAVDFKDVRVFSLFMNDFVKNISFIKNILNLKDKYILIVL